jgi:hypothetical protein
MPIEIGMVETDIDGLGRDPVRLEFGDLRALTLPLTRFPGVRGSPSEMFRV